MVVMENDQVPRDERTEYAKERTRLSHERTFLAWLRTGLACVAGGIAVVKLLLFRNETHQQIAKFAGLFLVICGIMIFLLTLLDYRRSHKQLKADTGYLGSMGSVTSLVIILIIISLMLCYIVFD
jgi:inner membrane protein YidH